ncbi:hypothetical protein Tco_1067807 [Tanacetum coccineum]|uniref:Uncharacterized protein n=1 Tax=Tanacetum coccineum TaxID=301880 RepID=A0ABQ5HDY2_9ASTR
MTSGDARAWCVVTKGLKRRLISVGHLDEEGYHRLGDISRIGMSMLSSKGKVPDVQRVDIYFCKPGSRYYDTIIEDCNRSYGRVESTGLRAEAPKMLWADSVCMAYLMYHIPYISTGLCIPEEEWRGKDTSLAHLKVFGCDSFVKVKDVCGEAMKCTLIGSGLDEMRYSFWDTKSHQVIEEEILHLWTRFMEPGVSSDTSEGSKNNRRFEDSGRSDEEYSKDGASSKEGGSETPQEPSYVGALNDTSTQHKSEEGFQLAGQKENLDCRLKEIMHGLIQAPRLRQLLNVDDMLVAVSDMVEFNKPKWYLPLVFEMKDRFSKKQVLGYVLTVGITTVEWESRLQKSITIFLERRACRDVHQVGDEREVEVLRSFNWPPSELITDNGVL